MGDFSPIAQEPLMDQVLFINEVSRSNSDTPHSVGILWKSDQPVAETSPWQHADIRPPDVIRTHNRSKQMVAVPRSATGIGTSL
jgi:hypothetical protein